MQMSITLVKSMFLLSLTGFCSLGSAAPQVVESRQDGVKVFAEPSKDSAVIKTLKKGESLDAKDRKGMFWLVSVGGKDGYVPFTAVARKAGSSSALESAIGSAAKESRDMDNVKGARSRSAVMGVRGLNESSETASAGSVTPNLRMVYSMEDREVTSDSLAKLGDLVREEVENRANALESAK